MRYLQFKIESHISFGKLIFSNFHLLTVAPLNIRLLGAYQPLSAGRRYDLLCQSAGSRPPAVITWWQNGVRLEKTTETVSDLYFIYYFILYTTQNYSSI